MRWLPPAAFPVLHKPAKAFSGMRILSFSMPESEARYRLFSFTTAGLAKSFAFLLGAYLAGIGVGSVFANWFCARATNSKTLLRGLVASVFGANLIGFLVAPVLFRFVVHVSYLWTLVPIGIAAACLGVVFPLLCHVSMEPDNRAGTRMSLIYLSNIIGSALGSYITGFVLMDMLHLREVCIVLALLGLVLAVVLALKAQLGRRWLLVVTRGSLAMTLFVVFYSPTLFHGMYEKMLMKEKYAPIAQFAGLVENRSGVIAVTAMGTHLVLGIDWQLALLLGAIVASTDAAAVFSVLRVVPLPRRLVHFHKVAVPSGVMIVSLEPGSPAERARLKPGDVIIGFGGRPVASIDDLQRLLSSECVGIAVTAEIVRATEILSFEVVPAESPKRN